MIDGEIPGSELTAWDARLLAETGFDYIRANSAITAYSTPDAPCAAGCHSPLLTVFHELCVRGHVRNLLELGSGMSTLFFLHEAQRFGFHFCAIEQSAIWHNLISEVAAEMGIQVDGYHLIGDGDVSGAEARALVVDHAPFDCAFVDGNGSRQLSLETHGRHLTSDCITLVDDCEQPGLWGVVSAWAVGVGVPPRRFMSHSRGIGVIDRAGKVDFVSFESGE